MSGDGSQEKTEEATPKKLEDARKKGQVAQSKDVTTAILMTLAFMYLWLGWDGMMERLTALMLLPTQYLNEDFSHVYALIVTRALDLSIEIIIPLLVIIVLAGLIGTFLVVGPVFSVDPLIPKFERLNPSSGLKKIFSMKSLLEAVKGMIMVVIFSLIFYVIFYQIIQYSDRMIECGYECFQTIFGHYVVVSMAVFILIFLISGFFDLGLQKRLYKREMKMTKEEVKREFKEREGDPQITSKRREIGQEYASGGVVVRDVRKATLIITGGPKMAVALYYNETDAPLPMLVTKGGGSAAQSLVKKGKKAGVVVADNKQLAQQLFDKLEPGFYIQEEMIEPVATFMGRLGL